MSEAKRLLGYYSTAVRFPGVSGFEIFELLDVRSRLAGCEEELTREQRRRLEKADEKFLRDAPAFYESVAAVGDLPELRRRADVPCSHWWWYLERLAEREPVQT